MIDWILSINTVVETEKSSYRIVPGGGPSTARLKIEKGHIYSLSTALFFRVLGLSSSPGKMIHTREKHVHSFVLIDQDVEIKVS